VCLSSQFQVVKTGTTIIFYACILHWPVFFCCETEFFELLALVALVTAFGVY
jgi:hypothetical protein